MLDFKCPGCNASHSLPDRVTGRKFRCPTCKAKIKHQPDGRFEIRENAPGSGPEGPADSAPEEDIPEISLPAETLRGSPPPAPPPPNSSRFLPNSLAGSVVGNYRLIGHIGSGSGGHVYVAEHLTLKRKMAVKLLAPAVAPSPDRVARLEKEAISLAKVDHPNVVHVYDFWVEKGNPYIAMQFVDGPSLDQAIKADGPYSSDRLHRLAQDLLQGLEVIHQADLLHRDIKPSNVLLTKEGIARLADFGLAWEAPQVSALPSHIFSGTAEYAAPELAVGQPPDVRTDLYALGGTLYKAATGRAPFGGSTVAEKLKRQLYEPVAAPRSLNPQISPSLEAFLLKLLGKDREARPPTAKEALKLLGPLGGDPRPKPTRRVLAVRTASPSLAPVLIASVVLAAALGIVAFLITRPKQELDARAKEKWPVAAQIPVAELPSKPLPPKPPPGTPDAFEQVDFDRLEVTMAAESPAVAVDACSEFLRKHPRSVHAEAVLLRKMELQQELDRRSRKLPDGKSGKDPSTPPKRESPPPPQDPPKPAGPLKRSATGVPCRPLPDPVKDGLLWLARHQSESGCWEMERFPRLCSGDRPCAAGRNLGSPIYQVGVNALSSLAFLGAGIGLNARDELQDLNLGDSLRESIRYLVKLQAPDGCIGDSNQPKQTYSQALAVHALAEAVRSLSTGSGFPEEEARSIRAALHSATDYLLQCQNPGVGWRYGVRPGDNDSSVTAATLLALQAARRAGVRVPDSCFESGLDWFRQVTDSRDQRVGYNAKGTGKVYVPGQNEQFDDHATLTAAAGLCQFLLAKDGKVASKGAVQVVARDLPRSAANSVDFYYWYYGTRFAAVAFGPGDQEAWKAAVVKALTWSQSLGTGSCSRGFWVPNDRWGAEGGMLYATALNTLTLEYATLPYPFNFGGSPPVPGDSAAPSIGWTFKLKSGGRVQALSYEELSDYYQVKVVGGSISILKDDVEQVLKVGAKGK